MPDPVTLNELGIDRRYVVHAAGATARKHLAGLADAWRQITSTRSDLQLVLCGPSDSRRSSLFAKLPRVLLPGRLSSSSIAALMAGSAAVVVPSTYEGFGLPALEGMACGAPVVAARCGALPEVVADAGLLVDPHGESLANALLSVVDDETLASRLRVQGPLRARTYDWQQAAWAHLRVYQQAFG